MLTLLVARKLAQPSSSADAGLDVSCAILEGRANVLDRRSNTSSASTSCSSLPAGAPCSAYFETVDVQRSLFRPCKAITGERCKAAGGAALPPLLLRARSAAAAACRLRRQHPRLSSSSSGSSS